MIDKEKLREALEFARENGLLSIEIDGIKMEVPPIKAEEPVQENDIAQPKTPYDDMDDDEILFWSTPYYEELQDKREQHAQKLKDEQNG